MNIATTIVRTNETHSYFTAGYITEEHIFFFRLQKPVNVQQKYV